MSTKLTLHRTATLRGRATGTTSRQMKAAPQGAVYVWCNDAFWYPKSLARHLGRGDLEVVSPGWLLYPHNWKGRRFSGIVLDHAVELTRGEFDSYLEVSRFMCGAR